MWFYFKIWLLISAFAGVLFAIRSDRMIFIRIFFIDPIKQLDISNFIMGLFVILLFMPFSIFHSIKQIFKQQHMNIETKDNLTGNLDLSLFPGIVKIKTDLETLKRLVDLFETRKTLARKDYDTLSDYEKNEVEILLIQTDFKLANTHSRIKNKEEFIKRYVTNITDILDEVNERYDELNEKAKALAEKNEDVKQFLDAVEWDLHENNMEFKIAHYINLKDLMKNTGKIRKRKADHASLATRNHNRR